MLPVSVPSVTPSGPGRDHLLECGREISRFIRVYWATLPLLGGLKRPLSFCASSNVEVVRLRRVPVRKNPCALLGGSFPYPGNGVPGSTSLAGSLWKIYLAGALPHDIAGLPKRLSL